MVKPIPPRSTTRPSTSSVSQTDKSPAKATTVQKSTDAAAPQAPTKLTPQQKAQRKQDKKMSGEMKRAAYRGKVQYKASSEVHGHMPKVSQEVNSELKALYAKHPNFNIDGTRAIVGAQDKEKIRLYENLSNALKTPERANRIAKAIAENKDHALFKQWGATKFSSFVALSDSNLEKSKVSTHGMTTMERAALLGYSTGDYDILNPAMRKGKGQLTDPYLDAYAKEVKGALKRIPDYQMPSGQVLHRAIYPSPTAGGNDWCKTAFVKGNTYSDFAFGSTALKLGQPGEWNLEIKGTKDAKNITPYSAWPGEAEVLVFPETKYTVHDVQGKTVTLIPQ